MPILLPGSIGNGASRWLHFPKEKVRLEGKEKEDGSIGQGKLLLAGFTFRTYRL